MKRLLMVLDNKFRQPVNKLVLEEWGSPIITKGVQHDISDAAGFIYLVNGDLAGYVLYNIQDALCEILVLQSMKENCGIGTALVNAVIDIARGNKCSKVWLITTNDNIRAIRYYQRIGFDLAAVHINALDKSRQLKPCIPLYGNENIPLKHEFEFELKLA